MGYLIGRKVGMTQIFDDAGQRLAVTVVDAGGNRVVQKKQVSGSDGYNAVKLGFEPAKMQEKNGLIRHRGVNKPLEGIFRSAGIEPPLRHLREFRCGPTEIQSYEVGQTLQVGDQFKPGDYVDVTGTSKGRGFTGVIKRHGFHRPKMTHGTHEFFRHGGAIGSSADPGRVFKGKKMPGQHGNRRVTVQNLRVVEVLDNEGLILIRGAVPGPSGGLVTVRSAVKKRQRGPEQAA